MTDIDIESLRHELTDEREKIGALLLEQIKDRDEIERLRAENADMRTVVRAAKALTNAEKPPFEGVESTEQWWDFCYALAKLEQQ